MGNNTSAFVGYLTPVGTAPLEGTALQDFFHDVIAGVSGLDNKLVRPRWLAEPANVPAAGTCWCAFGIMDRPSDTYPYQQHVVDGAHPDGIDKLQRQETLNVLCSIYDLGSSGLADQVAAQLRDGMVIPQNNEALLIAGFTFVASTEPVPVPTLESVRWQYRIDMTLVFRRQIDRTYQVLTLESATGQLITDSPPTTTDIIVEQP